MAAFPSKANVKGSQKCCESDKFPAASAHRNCTAQRFQKARNIDFANAILQLVGM